MPQTAPSSDAELAIALDSPHAFQPGEVIAGRVLRIAPIVSPNASVSIKLFGRTKVKVTVRRSQTHTTGNRTHTTHTTHHYRSRYSLFEVQAQSAPSGPLHVAAEGQPAQWPFALQIPVRPWPSVGMGSSQNKGFLPLDPGSIASHGIPFTFFCEHNEYHNRTLECFTEYVVEATMRHEHGSKTHTVVSKLPITIRPAPSPLVRGFDMRRVALPGDLRSQRLLPGMENADLSFKEKTAKFFHSSKIPKLVYRVEVDCPSVIQLGVNFPFAVRVVPDRAASSESLAKVEPVVHMLGAHFKLKARTDVLADSLWSETEGHGVRYHEFDLAWKQDMLVPTGADAQFLDIGNRMNLCLYPGQVNFNGGSLQFPTPIYPSFTTYNIQHTHSFKWELRVGLASESFKFDAEQPVLVLGPPQ
ncbi:hypothetical protein GQ53DRAFT_750812 [Thozetella sp. PMI_491]|nr:hypothetical protein GQ53DRAFT_750812 [Thozetella sp. PMI_491]